MLQSNYSSKRLIFCQSIAVLFSAITIMGAGLGMTAKQNTAVGLLGLSFAVVPVILVGLKRICLCTSDNFVEPIGSGWEKRKIWLGVDAKKYCDAFNCTLFLCIFSLITCIMQCLCSLPLEESKIVVQWFTALWYVWVAAFFVYSVYKVRWKSYVVTSVVLIGITGAIKPIFGWSVRQILTMPMFIFNSVLVAIVLGGITALLFGYYGSYLGKCITTSVYLTEQPDEVKLVTKDGSVWDRSKTLFYPDFNSEGVKLTFCDDNPPVFYYYSELQECSIKGDGKSLGLVDGTLNSPETL